MNIVLVVIDSLRAGNLGCYGYDKPTSPTIDELASQGVLFKNCYATANCTDPSLTSILSGRYPLHHGVLAHGPQYFKENYRRREETGTLLLPEILKNYDNACVDYLPLLKDKFSRFEIRKPWWVKLRSWPGRKLEGTPFLKPALKLHTKITGKPPKSGLNPKRTYNQARMFVDKMNEPFFLLIHDWNVHGPHNPPDEYLNMFDLESYNGHENLSELQKKHCHPVQYLPYPTVGEMQRAYDASIRWVDEELGKFVRWLKEKELWDDTLFIITSDHGENLSAERPIFLTHRGFYEATLHVPLIVHHPMFGDFKVNDLVSHVDIAPTVLDMLEVKTDVEMDGKSLLPLLKENELHPHEAVYAQVKNLRMMRTENYKLINVPNPEEFRRETYWYKGNGLELYNLKRYSKELKNIAEENPFLASRFEKRIDRKEEELRTEHEKSRIKTLISHRRRVE